MKISKDNKTCSIFSAVILSLFLFSCAATNNNAPYKHSPQDRMLSHMQRGQKYYENGSYNKAEREFLQVLRNDSQNTDAHYKLGVVYCRIGHFERGRLESMQVIEMDSEYSKAYYNLGALYANEGPLQNIEKAAILFRRHLELGVTSKNREKIKAWLEVHDNQGRMMNHASDLQTLEQPSDNDFKKWLKQQSEALK